MKLDELLRFNDIIIQCPDEPDADSIAAGWALLMFFQSNHKKVRLVYGGEGPIKKNNLVLMTEQLNIPIENAVSLTFKPRLLITVGCQYGAANVRQLPADSVAIIDHHKLSTKAETTLCEVRDNYGSTSTLVWDLLNAERFYAAEDGALSTALYYGLYMETGCMQELRHPKDKDMRDMLKRKYISGLIHQLESCNLSLDEMRIVGNALLNYEYDPEGRFAIVDVEPCEQNVLGVINNILIEGDVIDTCLAYCSMFSGTRLSIRSCTRQTLADELAEWLTNDLGAGGGQSHEAGGFIPEALLSYAVRQFTGLPSTKEGVFQLMHERMKSYNMDNDVIDTTTTSIPDLSRERVYQKRCIPIGYVRMYGLYPLDSKVLVRSLEGDFYITVKEDTYVIIGSEGEVYTNTRAYLKEHNDLLSEPYELKGEYAPTLHSSVAPIGESGIPAEPRSIVKYAKKAVPKKGSMIYARELKRKTKVFVPWTDRYMTGNKGDWLAARKENPKDMYIIKNDIFRKTYAPVR